MKTHTSLLNDSKSIMWTCVGHAYAFLLPARRDAGRITLYCPVLCIMRERRTLCSLIMCESPHIAYTMPTSRSANLHGQGYIS